MATSSRGPLIQAFITKWLDQHEIGQCYSYVHHLLSKLPDMHMLDVENPAGEIQFLLTRIILLVTLAKARDDPLIHSKKNDFYFFFDVIADLLEDADFGTCVYKSGVQGTFQVVKAKRRQRSNLPARVEVEDV